MIAPDAETPAALCRTLVARVGRAESFAMADWLALRPDGRTVKEAFAEAARLAWELDRRLGGPEDDVPAEAPPGTQATERGRRPALVLIRELRECLTRVAGRQTGDSATRPTVAVLRDIATLIDAIPVSADSIGSCASRT